MINFKVLKIEGNTFTVDVGGAIEVVAVRDDDDPYVAIPAALAEAAEERPPTYRERRLAEYPPIREQLDMMAKDPEGWRRMIADIKARHPKPVG